MGDSYVIDPEERKDFALSIIDRFSVMERATATTAFGQ